MKEFEKFEFVTNKKNEKKLVNTGITRKLPLLSLLDWIWSVSSDFELTKLEIICTYHLTLCMTKELWKNMLALVSKLCNKKGNMMRRNLHLQ